MIHIITHCYATRFPQYAVFLRAHLSSLLLYPPKTRVQVTVCCDPEDKLTEAVLEDFRGSFLTRLEIYPMSRDRLFRRSIGRNEVSLKSKADLVWFADVDHVFVDGCLDSLDEKWPKLKALQPNCLMVYPNEIMIHKTHAIGNKFWKDSFTKKGRLLNIDYEDFTLKINHKAIGGIQIVDGNYVREFGYLNNQKRWLKPTEPSIPFPSFTDDVKFRNLLMSRGIVCKISIPNLYRLRHSNTTYKQVIDNYTEDLDSID